MTQKNKLASSAFWSVLEKGGQQGISFLVFMILARLVGPEEYGLANICFIYFLLTGIIVWGLVDGIVSLQIEDDLSLSSLFWTSIGLGIGLSIFCIATAGLLATALEQPKLETILYCFSIVPFLLALSAVPNMVVMKAMNFKLYAIRTFIATITGGAVGLALAFRGYGAYAIVWQQVAFYVVMNLIIWPYAGWQPRFRFSARSLVDAVKPGLNAIKVSGLAYVDQQFPRLVIADLLGAGPLGYYAFVMRIRLALQEILVTAPLVVLYPSMSRMKGNPSDQSDIAGKALLLGCSFLFPLLSIASATAPIYVPFIFGESWNPAIILLQIYVISAAALPFNFVVREIFRANNRLNVFFRYNVVATLLGLSMLFLLLASNGLILMALGIAVVGFAAVPVYIIIVRRSLDIDLWNEAIRIWPFALASVLSFLAIVAFRLTNSYLVNVPLQFIAAAGIGTVVFIACSMIFGSKQTKEIISLLKSALRRVPA